MRVGGFPSRDAFLRRVLLESRRGTRRTFLGSMLGLSVGLGFGVFLGYRLSGRTTPPARERGGPSTPPDTELEWARQMARRPLPELVAYANHFSSVAAARPEDRELAAGMIRLGFAVVARGDPQSEALADRVLRFIESAARLQALDPLVRDLKSRLREKR